MYFRVWRRSRSFGLPRPELGESWYRFAVASVDQGELRATGGVRIVVDGGYELLQEADTIVILAGVT